MRVGKPNRPAPLSFANFPSTESSLYPAAPLTCPSFLDVTSSGSNISNATTTASMLPFEHETFKSVPSSPWSSSMSAAPTIADLMQAMQTISLFQQKHGLGGALGHHLSSQPNRLAKMSEVSRKVFVGGLPADADKHYVQHIFEKFGKVCVDCPRPSVDIKMTSNVNGYVFLVYDQMESVQKLLSYCEVKEGRFFYTFGLGKAQIRPWYVNDCIYGINYEAEVDIRNTVFVGGVPRPATAEQLSHLLSQFGEVVFASIDCCPELHYPKGAGRVIFAEHKSFLKAIKHRFVRMDMLESHKKDIEIKPYVMHNQLCDECTTHTSELFCSDIACLQYYCRACFDQQHTYRCRRNHRVVVREGERTREVNSFHNLEHYMSNLETMNF